MRTATKHHQCGLHFRAHPYPGLYLLFANQGSGAQPCQEPRPRMGSKIQVNTLIPGFFPAEQNRKVLTPDRVDAILGHTPAGRFGGP